MISSFQKLIPVMIILIALAFIYFSPSFTGGVIRTSNPRLSIASNSLAESPSAASLASESKEDNCPYRTSPYSGSGSGHNPDPAACAQQAINACNTAGQNNIDVKIAECRVLCANVHTIGTDTNPSHKVYCSTTYGNDPLN